MDWIVFKLNGKVISKISVEGYEVGEIQATRELLAYEHGVDVSEVKAYLEEEK